MYSLELKNYSLEIIVTIPIGSKDGELGKTANDNAIAMAFHKPGPIVINLNSEIYIFDMYNFRINVYNLNLKYIDKMDIEKKIFIESSRRIFRAIIDNSNRIYAIAATGIGLRLIMFDTKNNILKDLMIENNNEVFGYDNFFPLRNCLLYYTETQAFMMPIENDNTTSLIDNYYIISEDDKDTIINKISEKNKLFEFLKENNTILNGNRLLTTDKYRLFKYWDFLQKNISNIDNNAGSDYRKLMYLFLGFDKNDNIYWGTNKGILVFNKYGEIIDYFKVDCRFCTIAPNGDVYYLETGDKEVTIYLIKNVWDPVDLSEMLTAPPPPKALSITATSFIDWKNAYIPAKVFDRDLTTSWLESAEGPGTGESITLKLDREISIDEIRIAPGFFNPKWWKRNNRVKDLRIKYDTASRIISFKDEMTLQKVKLPGEIRFSEITFEITDVYLSGKDNDTGISEIEFYSKGKKVEINVSGVN